MPTSSRCSLLPDRGVGPAPTSALAILGGVSETEVEKRPGINWVQVVAGALAAVSSAVLLSTLGVAGTIIGAAMGSVIASVASAWYSRGLDASRQQMAAQAAARKRVAAARSQLDAAAAAADRGEAGAEAGLLQADEALEEAEAVLVPGSEAVEPVPHDPLYGAEAGRRLPYKRIGLIAGGLFVAVMVAITAFELATGRAVSSYTGGSDRDTGFTVPGIPKVTQDEGDDQAPGEQPGQPTDTDPTDDADPTDDPTIAPTADPTVEPTPTLEPSETVAPTEVPTVEPEPTSDGSTG